MNGASAPAEFPQGRGAADSSMSEPKQPKKQTKLRRIMKAVLWTAGIFLLLSVLVCLVAVFTVDQWIVPFGAWCAGVEVEGEPCVSISFLNREVVLTGLKVNLPAGQVEAKTFGLRLDGIAFEGGNLKEVRVSHVRADGVRAMLDFSKLASVPDVSADEPISGEKVRAFSHLVWNKASKPVVHMTDLTLRDSEVRWQSGAAQSLIAVSGLDATFDGGIPTRPELDCDIKYRLNDPQRSIQFGVQIKASALQGGDGVTVSAMGDGPLVVDLPDSHLEFPALESTDMVVQYEPGSGDSVLFSGKWMSPERWEYKPWDLSLDNAVLDLFGTLALDGENLRLQIGAEVRGADLVCRGSAIPGDVYFEANGRLKYDLASGGMTLDALTGNLTGPSDGRIDMETTGVFEFVRYEDATYTLNPQAAKLKFSTGIPVDLTPFDPVLPFDSVDTELNGEYFIELDPEKLHLLGGAGAAIRNPKTGMRLFDAEAEFETEGITRIGSLNVSRCSFAFYDGEDRICRALFAGEYNIRTASLKGELNYNPYRMIETFGSQELADLCLFLDDANLRDAEHEAEAELDLDLVNMSAKLREKSHLSNLALTGAGGNPLELDAVGDAVFMLAPDGSGWQLECALDLKAGNDLHAVIHAAGGSETDVSGNIELDQLSDVFVHQMAHKFMPGRADPPFFRFVNATASADFRYDPWKNRISLTRTDATVDNGAGHVACHCESELVWENGAFLEHPVDFKLKTAGLPVSFLDPLLEDGGGDFGFAGGVLTSEMDIHIDAGGKTVGGEGKLVGTDLTVLLHGAPRELARLGANAAFQFNRENSLLILPELNIDIQDRQARQTLFAAGSGSVDLADECRLRMLFPEARFGPEVLYLIGYGVERSFYFEDLDTAGEIEFNAEHMFKEMSWTGGMKINRLRLQSDEPEEYRFPELSGRLDGELSWADGELFGDVVIRLMDGDGVEHISGQYQYRRGVDSLPKFISSSLDLPFSVSYFRYNHNPDPSVEKKALRLVDKMIELDLHGIFARNHALIFSATGLMELRDGENSAILVPQAVFSGDVFGTASVEILVKDGTWPFKVDAALSDIPFDKSFAIFLSSDDNPEIPHGLKGFIRRLDAVVQGEGFTTETLMRNLQADCKAELEGVSLRSSLREQSVFLNILLLPLVSVPRLIDYVPGDMVRRALRLATAGAVMDMISGEAPIEFKRGTMELSIRHGVIDLNGIELEGDLLEHYHAKGMIDLTGARETELETVARFAFFYWPFYLSGNIVDPEISYGKSISHFFTDNAKYLLTLFPNMILSAFTEEDEQEIDRQASEKEKAEKAEKEAARE